MQSFLPVSPSREQRQSALLISMAWYSPLRLKLAFLLFLAALWPCQILHRGVDNAGVGIYGVVIYAVGNAIHLCSEFCSGFSRWRIESPVAGALPHGTGQHKHTALFTESGFPFLQKCRKCLLMIGSSTFLLEYLRTLHAVPVICSPFLYFATGIGFLIRFSVYGLSRITILLLCTVAQNIVGTILHAAADRVQLITVLL